MYKKLFFLFLVTIITINPAYSWIKWQTTKQTLRTGQCQLEGNKIRVITHPHHLDIEEEAVIRTTGEVTAGDPRTLEISGEFSLTNGASLRSMLLWNGDIILKAKLLDRDLADTIIDTIVNKTYKDPALLKCIGKNRYLFRIYPVAINNTRKIRILYTVPLQLDRGNIEFEFQPAFTLGAERVPTQIPVEFIKSDTLQVSYVLHHGKSKKLLQFGSTYLIPFGDFHRGDHYNYYSAKPQPICLIPDTSASINKAYMYTLPSSMAAGCYASIFSTIPDSLEKLIANSLLKNYTLETKIKTTDKVYLTEIPKKSVFNIYIKSTSPWDGIISWQVYDSLGTPKIAYTQTILPDTDPVRNAMLPLLWGSRYTHCEGLGNLGGLFGFVDKKMSLLALEKDSLPLLEAIKYVQYGVPPLLAQEIFADTSKLDIPKENILIDVTGITKILKGIQQFVSLILKPNNLLIVQLNSLDLPTLTLEVFDMSGRKIKHFKNLRVAFGKVEIMLPRHMKGVFVVRVLSGSFQYSQKLIVK